MGGATRIWSNHYDKIREGVVFRREVAERVAIGFDLPKPSIVPRAQFVPNSAKELEAATA